MHSGGVAGLSRRTLQKNLLRKFLNYTEAVRGQISEGDVNMAMMRDVHEVVDCGFMKGLEVVRMVGKLLVHPDRRAVHRVRQPVHAAELGRPERDQTGGGSSRLCSTRGTSVASMAEEGYEE